MGAGDTVGLVPVTFDSRDFGRRGPLMVVGFGCSNASAVTVALTDMAVLRWLGGIGWWF